MHYSFAAKMLKMYSSEDLEKFYFDCQTEWMPRVISIQAYCSRYNVPNRKGGSYPIDNNLTERSVRLFTTKRKCSLHFGSDDGVEMSAVYHSIISTLKLCGKSVWNFFGDYFRCEVLGLDTYKDYLPALSR